MKFCQVTLSCLMLLLVSIFAPHAVGQESDGAKEIAWYDMDHCDICKNMASMKDQMPRIKWDNQLLDNGMIMIARVPNDMKKEMEAAEKGVEKTVARLTQGESLDMCGFCMNYGGLMEGGAKIKDIKMVGVTVTLITSDDPEMVKKIHKFAEQSKTEHKKMMSSIKKANPKKKKSE